MNRKKKFDLTDEIREEMRIRPDRADRYEVIIARGEVLSDGREADELLRDAKQCECLR